MQKVSKEGEWKEGTHTHTKPTQPMELNSCRMRQQPEPVVHSSRAASGETCGTHTDQGAPHPAPGLLSLWVDAALSSGVGAGAGTGMCLPCSSLITMRHPSSAGHSIQLSWQRSGCPPAPSAPSTPIEGQAVSPELEASPMGWFLTLHPGCNHLLEHILQPALSWP